MLRYPQCDWCGNEIRGRWATITPGGHYTDGKQIDLPGLTYHTSHRYDSDDSPAGISEMSCFGHALRLLNLNGDFPTPDAGMEWKLVPASENYHYENPYTSSALGTTPLAELGLSITAYRKLTKGGVFTVEHVADMRARGVDGFLTVKQLGLLDAALLERGLLPGRGAEAGGRQ